MAQKNENVWLFTGSVVFLALVALGFVLHYTKVFLVPFILAAFIISIVSPLLDWQVLKLKIPRSLAVVFTLLIVVVVIGVIVVMVTGAVNSIIEVAGQYTDSFKAFTIKSAEMLDNEKLKANGIDAEQMLKDFGKKIPGFVTDTIGQLKSAAAFLFLLTIFVIFMISGRDPGTVRQGVLGEIDQKIRRFIVTKMVSSAATGTFVWLVLTIFQLKLAAVFGMLAFLLNFIPSVGSIIATLLPIPVAVAQFDSSFAITMVIVLPGCVQIAIGNFLEPKFLGQSMKLHPITILLALSFWGLLWQIVGMFLAVPITAIIRIIFMQFEMLRPAGELMAGNLEALTGEKDIAGKWK